MFWCTPTLEGLWEGAGPQPQASWAAVTADELRFAEAKPSELCASALVLSMGAVFVGFWGARQSDGSWTGSVGPQGFATALPGL